MYSKEELQELRDEMNMEKREGKYLSGIYGKVADHICTTLMFENNPDRVYASLKQAADLTKGLPLQEGDTDFELAFDMVFGDITKVPLHLEDALAAVARWRIKRTELVTQ